jgi:UDP-glucose 4-epimerase
LRSLSPPNKKSFRRHGKLPTPGGSLENMNILVAGGAGYIGTHSCVSLLQSGHQVIVVDSLVNSRPDHIQRIQDITGKRLEFVESDVRDRKYLNEIFSKYRIDAVINFAGHKAVGDSVKLPLDYYDNNINCAISLLECMASNNVKVMVFSSSAAVYAESAELPINEGARTEPQSPYGRTKLYIEEMLRDVAHADKLCKIAILRYFNPVGAHPSGLIGEQPNGIPGNLMPVIAKVAQGELQKLNIFGGDYGTLDGTAVRDYIHVMDLAGGHSKAIQKLGKLRKGSVSTINLGTGKGYSVLEILKTFEEVCGRKIPFDVVNRRAGDVACSYADPALAKAKINWNAEFDVYDMCKDAWNWHLQHSTSSRIEKN